VFAARGTRLELLLPPQRHGEFLLQNLAIAAIVGAVILRYFYVQAQTRRTVEAEERARFEALQARIRPHFMFNSMNTIASLTRTDPALAEQVVEDLSDLFRDVLAEPDRPSTLARELERLRVEEHCAADRGDARVPSLLLQPLVENAVYHGIEPLVEGGTIVIETAAANGVVTVCIRNPYPDRARVARPGNHMALTNTAERLRLQFGALARIESRGEGGVFTVRLVFPYEKAAS
jgi:two-component system sensor histidine kinase AlgZ